jgi:hypothetical protein
MRHSRKSNGNTVIVALAAMSVSMVIGAFGFLNYHMIANGTTAEQSITTITSTNQRPL